MLFALGFLSLMVGCALLVLGEISVSKTRRVPARASRIAGALQVLYFPLVLGLRYLWLLWDVDRFVPANVCFAILWVVLAMASGWIALRAAYPGKAAHGRTPRFSGVPERDPFAADGPAFFAPDDTAFPESSTVAAAPFEPVDAAAKPKKAPPKAAPKAAGKSVKEPAQENPFDFS